MSKFTLQPEKTELDYVQKLWSLKLGSQPFDQFATLFNITLLKCPPEFVASEKCKIAAFRQALSAKVQNILKFAPDGREWQSLNQFLPAARDAVHRFNASASDNSSVTYGNKGKGKIKPKRQQQQNQSHGFSGGRVSKPAVTPHMNSQISAAAAAITGQAVPKITEGRVITVAKWIASQKAGICAKCGGAHPLKECPQKSKFPVFQTAHLYTHANCAVLCRRLSSLQARRQGQLEAQQAAGQKAKGQCLAPFDIGLPLPVVDSEDEDMNPCNILESKTCLHSSG